MNEKEAGWLIIHTENKNIETFSLKEGRNLIGRKTTKNTPNISISDNYVSRHHAVVFVKQNQKYEYEYSIADNAEALGKPSMNGTFVNGNTNRLREKRIPLKDGDTIQIGETKLVLKTTQVAIDVESAIKLVGKTGYEQTVNVRPNKGGLLKTVIKK